MAEKDMNSKVLEELNDVFSDISNVLLFNGNEVISENVLSETTTYSNYTANGKIREQERDVDKCWNKSEIRIAKIGFENETEDEPDMPLRVFNYDAAGYRAQFSPTNNNPRFPVFTLVLYFGYLRQFKGACKVYAKFLMKLKLGVKNRRSKWYHKGRRTPKQTDHHSPRQ